MGSKETAAKVQENLEAVNVDAPDVEWDIDSGFQAEWNDGKPRKIVFVPSKDRTGIAVYVYTDGLNTARMGLSTRAAIMLSDGIMKMLREHPAFLDKLLQEPIKEMEDENYKA
jgi:hypothetical protein